MAAVMAAAAATTMAAETNGIGSGAGGRDGSSGSDTVVTQVIV
jgi:hypothetical protein